QPAHSAADGLQRPAEPPLRSACRTTACRESLNEAPRIPSQIRPPEIRRACARRSAAFVGGRTLRPSAEVTGGALGGESASAYGRARKSRWNSQSGQLG